ncbi:GNAT family N-acetyltransferase [Curtobacterium sp. UCD-KPL2560]|uniref:GNAT family N-acetyltransferase n=1 Tax=Curtobacterium sp. UCD-KPL2560 TaxID=1885315 RepID=UPI000825DBC2|nr:GNAT family N-acetyltransferase [Curtobacterium sp. UCD-KPL2560]
MTIALRRVTADDWQEWRTVRLAALAEAPDAFGSTLADWQDAPEDRWRTRLSLPDAVDLLAVDTEHEHEHEHDHDHARHDHDHVIGMATGVPDVDDRRRAELISMWVAPEARGSGVARQLIDAVARAMAEHGAEHLELSVMPDNDRARRTYERAGFARTDTLGDALPDGRHELVMSRDLAAERTLLAYERGADRYADRTDDHRSGLVDDLLALVPAGSHVLELGSGPGRDADALEAAGLRVDRTDGAAAFVDRLRAAGHDARLLDVRRDDVGPDEGVRRDDVGPDEGVRRDDVGPDEGVRPDDARPDDDARTGTAAGWGGPYDAVFANAVLLHVDRDATGPVLERARRAVRPGGVLAATVKRGDGAGWSDRKLDDPRWFTYWTEDALAAVVSAAGWHGVHARETTRPGADERWLTVTAHRPEED